MVPRYHRRKPARHRTFEPAIGFVSGAEYFQCRRVYSDKDNLVLIMCAEPKPICIIDDDAPVRNSIEQLLDSDGLKAQSFEDAEDFLSYARSHAVPLAILDVWMPKTSGLEVQAQLRVVSPKTKVIVMTAREIPAIRAAALEGGAFAFLSKPFDDDAFLSLVHQALALAA